MEPELLDRVRYPSFGECIYCGASGDATTLTDEHIIPYSLGGNAIILRASCKSCAAETASIEQELGRKTFWDLRLNVREQTRRPKDMPKALPFDASIMDGGRERFIAEIADRPFFTTMPVWGPPTMLSGAVASDDFSTAKAHVFYWIPPNIRETLKLEPSDTAEIQIPDSKINIDKFARAIAKIAYCQAVVKWGLHGFRRLAITDIILGRYRFVSQFVGCQIADPDRPLPNNVKHLIRLSDEGIGSMRLLLAEVRLYGSSGTKSHGLPTYSVVVGAPPVRKRRAS
jgi:hypothetical protein